MRPKPSASTCCCSPARRSSTADARSSTRTAGCASPTDACCSAARWIATSSQRLRSSGYPFVAIGRRDGDAAVRRASTTRPPPPSSRAERSRPGTASAFYVRLSLTAESSRDRCRCAHAPSSRRRRRTGRCRNRRSSAWTPCWRDGARQRRDRALRRRPDRRREPARPRERDGRRQCPRDLSMVALGEQIAAAGPRRDFTRLSAPRTELGRRRVALLDQLLERHARRRRLAAPADCWLRASIDGSTLGVAARPAPTSPTDQQTTLQN